MRLNASTIATLHPWFPTLDLASVRIVQSGPASWFVRSVLHQGAMTVAPYIFYGRSRLNPTDHASLALLAHELKHVEQYRALGHARFLLQYARDLIAAKGHYSRDLPLEAPCYALQAQVKLALDQAAPPHT